jgi:glycosyltransferase involved in cell wall biosynthesis
MANRHCQNKTPAQFVGGVSRNGFGLEPARSIFITLAAMNEELPLVSVLLPVHPHVTEVKSAEAARRFDYPHDKLEIVIVRTTDLSIGPGVKRNAGLKAIRGELVYFLDDDSVAEPGNVKRAVRHFSDPQVKIIGGPNVCPDDAPLFERVIGVVMGSWLAFGPSRTRYRPVGKLRECGEQALISSHLIARRDAVMEVGFDPKLWPNEENAMMNGVKQRGGKLLYDPEFLSRRRPRRTLKAYAKMLLFYGGGRAQQFRLYPSLHMLPNFIPPLFCLYLLALPVLIAVFFSTKIAVLLFLLPLVLYLLILFGQTISAAAQSNLGLALLAMPLIALTNILYGLGFWRGWFIKISPPPPVAENDIRFETVPV